MGVIKQRNIKSQTYYFHNDIIDIKTFDSNNIKLDKKSIKILTFTILDLLQLKKMVLVMISKVKIHYICLLIMRADM